MAEITAANITRIVASSRALDGLGTVLVMRIAPDEALVLGSASPAVDDPWAIIEVDTSWFSVRYDPVEASSVFANHASWPPPTALAPFAQGKMAGLPVKALWENGFITVLCSLAYRHDFDERIGGGA